MVKRNQKDHKNYKIDMTIKISECIDNNGFLV